MNKKEFAKVYMSVCLQIHVLYDLVKKPLFKFSDLTLQYVNHDVGYQYLSRTVS